MRAVLALTFFTLLLAHERSSAACSSPAGEAGQILFQTPNFLFCDDTNWQNLTSNTFETLNLGNGTTSVQVGIATPAGAGSYSLVLPGNAGSANQVLKTDGAGVLSWVDQPAPGVAQTVRVATTANITLSGTQTIDGVALSAGDRVLVKNQSTASQNGIYEVSAGAWTRASDMDTWSEAVAARVIAKEGSVGARMTYASVAATTGTLGTTSLSWSTHGFNGSNFSFGLNSMSTSTGSENIGIGGGALRYNTSGTSNIAMGLGALQNNTTGGKNIALGESSSVNMTTGSQNTALGYSSLYSNTTGWDNLALGTYSLNANTVGVENVGLGNYALLTNRAKSESVAVGTYAMSNAHNTTTAAVSYNTAVGGYALQGSTTAANNSGTNNTALGHSALKGMTSGSSNIGLGYNAGSGITTGSNNVVIGSNTGSTIATSSNNILIADGAGNERIRVDSSGNIGVGITSPSSQLHMATTDAAGAQQITKLRIQRSIYDTDGDADYIDWYSGAATNIGRISLARTGSGQSGMGFWTLNTGGAGFIEHMRLDKDGNLGVGTTSPARKLHVNGPMRLTASTTPATPAAGDIFIDSADSNKLKYYDGTSWVSLTAGGGGTPAGANTQIQFNNSGAFGANANLIWDNTNNRLGVNTAIGSMDRSLVVADGATDGVVGGRAYMGGWSGGITEAVFSHKDFRGSNTDYALRQNNLGRSNLNSSVGQPVLFEIGASEKMRLDSTGYLGIGTSAPDHTLNVIDDVNTFAMEIKGNRANANGGGLRLQNTAAASSSTGTILSFQGVSETTMGYLVMKWDGAANTAANMQFTTLNGGLLTEKMRISSDGNVGLSDLSPDANFEISVNGNTTGSALMVSSNDDNDGDLFIVQESGNVGIGTTAPARLLHVAGPMRLTASTTPASPAAGDIFIDSAASNALKYYNGTAWVSLTGGSASAIDDLSDGISSGSLNNLFLGNGTGANYSSDFNTGVGYQAMTATVPGPYGTNWRNTALGTYAMKFNVGADNTAVGQGAMESSSTAGSNTAIGTNALFYSSGTQNVAVGSMAGRGTGAYAGSDNTFIGTLSGNNIGAGSNNTFIGRNSGSSTTTGNSNILIGKDVQASAATASNELNIGNTIYANLSNDYVGIGVTVPARPLHVNGAMRLTASTTPASPAAGDIFIDSAASNALKYYNGTAWVSLTGGGGSPAGASGQLQFNNAGAFGADTNLHWDNTNKRLGIGNATPASALDVVGASSGAVVTLGRSSGTLTSMVANNNTATGLTLRGGTSSPRTGAEISLFGDTNSTQAGIASITYGGAPATGRLAVNFDDGTTTTEMLTVDSSGKVGIGTISPSTKLDVVGNVRTAPINVPAGTTTIDVSQSNHYTVSFTGNACTALTLNNMTDGTTYTFATSGVTSGTCSFIAAGLTFEYAPANAAIANDAIYTLLKVGTKVYVSWLDNWGVAVGGGGTPAGATGQVQFNNAGAFAADSSLHWDNTNKRLGIGTASPATELQVNSTAVTSDVVKVVNSTGFDIFRVYETSSGHGYVYLANSTGVDRIRLASSSDSYFTNSLGVGTTTPRAKLDVNGAVVGAPAVNNATSTIDFIAGNIQYTTANCGAFNLHNLKDGGSYSFIVKGTTSATCSFNAYSDAGTTALTVKLPPDHGATTATKQTFYTFVVAGTDVYVSWVTGY